MGFTLDKDKKIAKKIRQVFLTSAVVPFSREDNKF